MAKEAFILKTQVLNHMRDATLRDPFHTVMNTTVPGLKRQCTALTRFGVRCTRPPIPGGLVCNVHGGAAPMARLAAQRRLLTMVEPAFDALMNAIAAGDIKEQIKAATIILDRAGVGPTSTLELKDERQYSELTREQLAARAEQIAAVLRRPDPVPNDDAPPDEPKDPSVDAIH